MNKTAELVSLWAKYEEENPKANLVQFCQDYIIQHEQKQKTVSFWNSPVPPTDGSILTKLLGRIAKLHNIYSMNAFKGFGINSFDEFLYMNSIANISNPKKTDIIIANFSEPSSGLLILDRLKKSKFIKEKEDPEDKRAKRLALTDKGVAALKYCYEKLTEINAMCFKEMSQEQIKLCIQQLYPVEASLAKIWLKDKKSKSREVS